MAIRTLAYSFDNVHESTRSEIPIYDGEATGYHDWEFRTSLRLDCTAQEDRRNTMSSIVEGLRGDAADIARDIGREVLLSDTGYNVLKDTLKAHVFPKTRAEAKVLHKHGHSKVGILSRQVAEPIANYISRRRRWWRQFTSRTATLRQRKTRQDRETACPDKFWKQSRL